MKVFRVIIVTKPDSDNYHDYECDARQPREMYMPANNSEQIRSYFNSRMIEVQIIEFAYVIRACAPPGE